MKGPEDIPTKAQALVRIFSVAMLLFVSKEGLMSQTSQEETNRLPIMPSQSSFDPITDEQPRLHTSSRRRFSCRTRAIPACAACGLGSKIEVEGRIYSLLYEGLTLHDPRRSAVRNLINASVRERVAMQIRAQDPFGVRLLSASFHPSMSLTQCRLSKLHH
jgi:hypothetical protein